MSGGVRECNHHSIVPLEEDVFKRRKADTNRVAHNFLEDVLALVPTMPECEKDGLATSMKELVALSSLSKGTLPTSLEGVLASKKSACQTAHGDLDPSTK